MPRLPPLPHLDWRDDAPISKDVGDVYFSGDGLAEKRAVFLAGCGLPERWRGREHVAIGELGFGTGLAFLAAWDMWRRHRPSPTARLSFLSFERALFSAEDARCTHARWPEVADLSAALLASWPTRTKGPQRIELPDGVRLTLFIDDIAAALPEADARIDAWFLDGFAPSKNPEMWSPDTMSHIARLSAPGAVAATYSVAAPVRAALAAAGFAVSKHAGHGRKKERLEAALPSPSAPSSSTPADALSIPDPLPPQAARTSTSPPRRILVIGAGIAGACAARAFLDRACEVTVLEAGSAPGAKASGNPLALIMPRLDAADSPAARALIAAYLFARLSYAAHAPEAMAALDVRHLARSDLERIRFAKLLADPPLDAARLGPISPFDPAAGLPHVELLHRGAFAVRPAALLDALLAGAGLRLGGRVASIADNLLVSSVTLATGERLEADLVIACAGFGLAALPGLGAPPLQPRLGQIETAPSNSAPNAVADGGYVVEALGLLAFGATFESPPEGDIAPVTDAARTLNLATLARLRADLHAPPTIASRAAIRAATPDRLPFAGAPELEPAPGGQPRSSRIRLLGGLGARGFLWAPLLAALLASEAFGEPLPLERSAIDLLSPGRFARRAARRGR